VNISQSPCLLEIFECDASPTGGADHLSSWCVVIVFVLHMWMSARKITAFFPLSLQSHRVTHLHTHCLEPRPCHAHSSRKVPKRIGSSFHQGIRAYERCRRWQELSPIWRVRSRVVINTTTLSYENRPTKNANTPHQTAKNLPGGV